MLWAAKECATADFGDARLTQRLVSLVTELTEHPQSSLPEALGEWSATKAAYRFFSNQKVTVKAIYDSHREATLDKIQDQPVILAIQDTTIFNFTVHRKTEGLGPIGQAGLSGFFLHSCLAVSTDGVAQGILAHRMWTRSTEDKGKRELRRKRPLEDKESARWIDVTKEARRAVPESTQVPRANERPERETILTLQAATVTLRTPPHRKKESLAPPTLNALLVREESPSDGEQPIEWMLLTTLPITTLSSQGGDPMRLPRNCKENHAF